jgi:hypothetical protein
MDRASRALKYFAGLGTLKISKRSYRGRLIGRLRAVTQGPDGALSVAPMRAVRFPALQLRHY